MRNSLMYVPCAALAATMLAGSPVQAASTIITGPGSYEVGATTVAEEPDLAGVVLADRLQPFTINGASGGVVTGFIQERVIRSDATGFLHFSHRVIIDMSSGFEPGSYLEWLDFDPVATGTPLVVGRRTDGLGSATSTIFDLAPSGMSRFDFNLIDLDGSSFSTQFHFWKSNATNFALTGQLRLSGDEFDTDGLASPISTPWYATYAPAPIPEPATWAMLLSGFAAVGWHLRRRKQKVKVAYA